MPLFEGVFPGGIDSLVLRNELPSDVIWLDFGRGSRLSRSVCGSRGSGNVTVDRHDLRDSALNTCAAGWEIGQLTRCVGIRLKKSL